jgi:hypothetical protein
LWTLGRERDEFCTEHGLEEAVILDAGGADVFAEFDTSQCSDDDVLSALGSDAPRRLSSPWGWQRLD